VKTPAGRSGHAPAFLFPLVTSDAKNGCAPATAASTSITTAADYITHVHLGGRLPARIDADRHLRRQRRLLVRSYHTQTTPAATRVAVGHRVQQRPAQTPPCRRFIRRLRAPISLSRPGHSRRPGTRRYMRGRIHADRHQRDLSRAPVCRSAVSPSSIRTAADSSRRTNNPPLRVGGDDDPSSYAVQEPVASQHPGNAELTKQWCAPRPPGADGVRRASSSPRVRNNKPRSVAVPFGKRDTNSLRRRTGRSRAWPIVRIILMAMHYLAPRGCGSVLS